MRIFINPSNIRPIFLILGKSSHTSNQLPVQISLTLSAKNHFVSRKRVYIILVKWFQMASCPIEMDGDIKGAWFNVKLLMAY